MKEINFDVDLGTGDLFSFLMRHTYSGISGIFGVIISIVSLIVCAVKFKELDTTAIMALIIIGLIFTVIQPLMLYNKARIQVKRNKNINAKLHYKLAEDGITISQGENEAKVNWYEIRKKVATGKALYVYMSPVRAFIFPKSQCGEAFDEINSLIGAKMEEYKDYEPEPEAQEESSQPEAQEESSQPEVQEESSQPEVQEEK